LLKSINQNEINALLNLAHVSGSWKATSVFSSTLHYSIIHALKKIVFANHFKVKCRGISSALSMSAKLHLNAIWNLHAWLNFEGFFEL
jgi:hypothetical protein